MLCWAHDRARLARAQEARTRQAIADAAARLFAERGYEQVAVSDVAREAEVSEQTVYNYFQTKEQLVTDRDQLVQEELIRLIRARAAGTTPAAAVRELCSPTWRGSAAFPPGSGAARSASWPRSARPSAGSRWRCQTARPAPSPPPSPRPRQSRPRSPSCGDRAGQRLPDHHHRGRTPHPRGPKPGPDRRSAAASHRSGPRRPRPLAHPGGRMRVRQGHSLPGGRQNTAVRGYEVDDLRDGAAADWPVP